MLIGRDLHKPTKCDRCGGQMKYNGVGEYKCEDCSNQMFDDYGKVRNYLESHKGATQGEVSAATGVSTNAIRQMLRDDRLEVAPNSAIFMSCEICGASIRSGRFCDSCQSQRAQAMKNSSGPSDKGMRGFGTGHIDNQGAKRFNR